MTSQHCQHISLACQSLELNSWFLASRETEPEIGLPPNHGIQDMARILVNDMNVHIRVLIGKGAQCIWQKMVCH